MKYNIDWHYINGVWIHIQTIWDKKTDELKTYVNGRLEKTEPRRRKETI